MRQMDKAGASRRRSTAEMQPITWLNQDLLVRILQLVSFQDRIRADLSAGAGGIFG